MRFSSFLAIGLSTLALAIDSSEQTSNGALNLPAIQAAAQVANKDAAALSAAIAGLTAANADTQVTVINQALVTLSNDLSQQAKKINASGAISFTELSSSLLTENGRKPWIDLVVGLFNVANSTAVGLAAKSDLIKKGPGNVDKAVEGIKSTKKAILDLLSVIPSQIPPAILTQISKLAPTLASYATAAASSAGVQAPKVPTLNEILGPKMLEEAGKQIDDVLDQIINLLKGTQTAFTIRLPPGISIPTAVTLPAGFSLPSGFSLPALPSGIALPSGVNLPTIVTAAPAANGAPKAPKATPKGGAPAKGPVATAAL